MRASTAAVLLPAAPAETLESLNGPWQFRLDPHQQGELEGWYLPGYHSAAWDDVTVPHTWQVHPGRNDYQGLAWYRRTFTAPAGWAGKTVCVEFEAVYHSAIVWVNGKRVGEHLGKGYTAFQVDITPVLRPGDNVIAVRADNSFNPNMLPRGNSYDWTEDGGIIRPVNLLVTPPVYIERVEVDAQLDLGANRADLHIRAAVRNASREAAGVSLSYVVEEEATGRVVARGAAPRTPLAAGSSRLVQVAAPGPLERPLLWHFDHPHLYRLTVSTGAHDYSTTFGVRQFEVRDGGFWLNGERVWLMGVERMAGSNPEYGMAEPPAWIAHDHADLKELNCVFTRVHWQQDRSVLDWCDRNGILIQVEVPAWGANTFKGMTGEPDPAIMDNGLEQLREMIARDRNHPSIFAWGLCNEVNGQNPPAYEFIRRMYEEAKRLDPGRLRTYASNSLENKTLDRDAAGMMDFISWNEYYGSWMPGTVEDMVRNLEEIHRAFPSKPIVISEYGFCECNPRHVGGDPRRIEILQEHTRALRERPWVGGAIFFDYNDYRTHIGDKGLGALKQRVHGVVDLYGARKPSFEALRREASPVEQMGARFVNGALEVSVRARKALPAYTLEGYTLRCVVYAGGNIPMEQQEAPLPRLAPGASATVRMVVGQGRPQRFQIEVMRPTGFSAASYVLAGA